MTATNGSSAGVSVVCGLIASTGQAVAHAPQSTHAAASTKTISASAKPGSPGAGWMQLTGHATTHEASAQQAWVTTYGTVPRSGYAAAGATSPRYREERPSMPSNRHTRRETGFIIPVSSASIRTSPNRSRSTFWDSGRSQ